MTRSNRRYIWTVVLSLNTLFWVAFWGYFFARSIATPRLVPWGDMPPFYSVFGRSFPMAAPAVFHSPVLQSAFWLCLPCWIVTWPLGAAMGIRTVLGTNAPGLRLVFITALSYLQWYLIVRATLRLWERFRKPGAPRSGRVVRL